MKKICVIVLILFSCNNKTKEHNGLPTDTDTVVIPSATDQNVPLDTDDHNRGTESTIALDSPTGPPHHLRDTSASLHKSK